MGLKVGELARRGGVTLHRRVPAVVIIGKLADCYSERGPLEQILKAAGLGAPLS